MADGEAVILIAAVNDSPLFEIVGMTGGHIELPARTLWLRTELIAAAAQTGWLLRDEMAGPLTGDQTLFFRHYPG